MPFANDATNRRENGGRLNHVDAGELHRRRRRRFNGHPSLSFRSFDLLLRRNFP